MHIVSSFSAWFQLEIKIPKLGSTRLGKFSARARSSREIPARTHHYSKNNFLGKMFSTNMIFFYSYRQKNKSQCRSMQTIQWPVCYTVFQRRKNLTHYKNSDQFQCRYLLEKTGSLWQDPTF